MKITSEELDKAIIGSINERLVNLFTTLNQEDYMDTCKKSKEFGNVVVAYITIFGEGDKTVKDLIFNCLMTGFEIGYIIAQNREVTQLEMMFKKGEKE